MITLHTKDKEVDITLIYDHYLGDKPRIQITGTGDLSHHLIEGLFNVLDRLSKMEDCSHRSREWKNT